MCVCARVRACVRACARARARVCVCVFVRARVCVQFVLIIYILFKDNDLCWALSAHISTRRFI